MAKKKLKIRKPKSGKSWRDWFSWGKRKESRTSRAQQKEQLYRRLKIAMMSIFLPLLPAGLVVGFFYMDKYIQAQRQANPVYGSLVFVDVPDWAHNEAMKKKLAAAAGGVKFELKEGVARDVAENLASLAWLYNVQVRVNIESILVYAKYREPQAIIKTPRGQTLYVSLPDPNDPWGGNDNNLVVLDYTPVEKKHIVEITGFADKDAPAAGKIWYASDVSAAMYIWNALKRMDNKICPQKPLRYEIEKIDVANFNGRVAATQSHIIFILKDATPVYWGTAIGQSSEAFEASEVEKLTKLYTFYQMNSYNIQKITKSIDLRRPESGIPRPE